MKKAKVLQVIEKDFNPKETRDVLETVIFTDIVKNEIGKCSAYDLAPEIRLVGFVWDLKPSRSITTIRRIITNSVKNN